MMFDVEHRAEELSNFLGTEDDRQLLRLLRKRENLFRRPVPFERHAVEKAQGRDGGVDRTGRFSSEGPRVQAGPATCEIPSEQRYLLLIQELVLSAIPCVSSLIRWRSWVMASSFVRWNELQAATPCSPGCSSSYMRDRRYRRRDRAWRCIVSLPLRVAERVSPT